MLASVPGHSQAQLAVLNAQIPQQATLKRNDAKLVVSYAGEPQFKPIQGTELTYAVNTTFEVIGVGGKYYVCHQGVWFVGPSPTGPWALADNVPPAIYTIPPSNPLYNVTYVSVYGATPAAVTYGYTAGYAMGFVTAGLLVYGTGYYYPPYVVPGVVPAYFPYPYSYAGSVRYNPASGAWARGGTVYGPYGGAATAGTAYNPATGAWAHGAAVYGPYGGAGAWSAYNPSTGTYAHGSAAWGPNGGTANASFYNPRYGVSGSTTQNANAYSRWGSSTISGPNQTVNTASGSNAEVLRARSVPARGPPRQACTPPPATMRRWHAPPAATSTPARTAMPTSTPTTAGRSGTTVRGNRCSGRKTAARGRRRMPARALRRLQPEPVRHWGRRTISNWNRTTRHASRAAGRGARPQGVATPAAAGSGGSDTWQFRAALGSLSN